MCMVYVCVHGVYVCVCGGDVCLWVWGVSMCVGLWGVCGSLGYVVCVGCGVCGVRRARLGP